jgi:hypothetical protein
MLQAILEEVAPNEIPEKYGGTGSGHLYNSECEQELAAYVQQLGAGVAAAGGTRSQNVQQLSAGVVAAAGEAPKEA